MRQGLVLCLFWVCGLLAGCEQRADWGLDQQGQPFDAQALQGRWVLVNYWAEWCTPCRREIPELNRLAVEGSLRVVGINFDALQGAALAKAVQHLGIRFPVASQDPSAALGWPRPQGLPQSYLLDAQGNLRVVLKGEQTTDSILTQLKQLQTGS